MSILLYGATIVVLYTLLVCVGSYCYGRQRERRRCVKMIRQYDAECLLGLEPLVSALRNE